MRQRRALKQAAAHRAQRRVAWFLGLLAVVLVLIAGATLHQHQQVEAQHRPRVQRVARIKHTKHHAIRKPRHVAAKPARPSVMREPIDWHQPSETVAYPSLTNVHNLTMTVRLDRQRVYINGNDKLLYTMYASTGIDGRTPMGHFRIGQRGLHFFNSSPAVRLGANYWTSIYQNRILFHTVPFDAQGHYDVQEASDLGKRAGSHGCVQLSIPDAKWIYDHVPTGTPVTISNH